MEALIPIFVILVIVGIGFGIHQFAMVSDLRSSEESNIAQIAILRRELSSLREKLQSIRLGDYKPTNSEIQSARSRIKKPAVQNESSSCFFCDEAIHKTALVCRHCGRPNAENIENIKKNDDEVRRILSRV